MDAVYFKLMRRKYRSDFPLFKQEASMLPTRDEVGEWEDWTDEFPNVREIVLGGSGYKRL